MPRILKKKTASRDGSADQADYRLSVVIPAYNEELNIEDAIHEVLIGLSSSVRDYEILIVDDGSSDRTAETIRNVSAGNQRIKLISHDKNRGYGAALTSGFQSARGNWILFTDADRQINMTELTGFLDASADHDMVIGFRTGRSDSMIRKILSRAYGLLVSGILGLRFRDINCPFKLFKKSTLDGMDLTSRGFLINAELLYKAGLKGCLVKEMPVEFHERQKGKSTVRLRHAFETIRELVPLLKHKSSVYEQ